MRSFQAFYETQLTPVLRDLEKARIKIRNKIVMIVGPVLILICLGLYYFWPLSEKFQSAKFAVSVIIGSLVIGLYIYIFCRTPKSYRYVYKEKVIKKVIHQVDPTLNYKYDDCISVSRFIRSQIFHQNPDRFGGDDLVSGKIGQTKFEFSEIFAEVKKRVRRNNRTTTEYQTIFRGFFFIADFNKHFQYRTFVLPDVAESTFGRLGKKLQSINGKRPPLVQLENQVFEREFVVYSEDQIEARYILTPTMMENLLALRKKLGKRICVSFVGSQIHFAIAHRGNMFEPGVWTSLVRPEQIQSYYDTIGLVVGIVEDLKLNRRIWSKQI